jgi:hypothetical protein
MTDSVAAGRARFLPFNELLRHAVAMRRGSAFVFATPLAVAIGFGLLAVLLGQSDGWDLRNYHLYNGWAFWTGRGDRDFAVAQLQSYYNPLLATFTYLLFANLPPWLSTFALGAVQGANVVPLFLIARRLLPPSRGDRADWLPFATALVGALGATQISELGGSIGDNLVSLPILCAFALVLGESASSRQRALLAGLLVGAATGIKLTVAPFAIGLLVAQWVSARSLRDRWPLFVGASAAAAVGFLVADGFWMLHLYREFGNPLHPLFGAIFGGDFAPPMPTRDDRFVPQTAIEWLFYPLIWPTAAHRVSDTFFFDLRVPLVFLALPLLLRRQIAGDARNVGVLLAGLGMAYVIWLALFGIYRYLAPLEMLAPLLVVLALERRAATAAVMLLATMLVLVRPPGWGHLHRYGASFLEADVPPMPGLDHATVVLAENEPLAFLALALPADARFVRIGGNLLGPPYPEYGMDREAARRLAAGDGPLYGLLADPKSEQVQAVLARQHLEFAGACAPIRSNLLTGKFAAQLCPLQRRVEAQPSPG